MVCPLCEARKARRHCPAVAREICPVCCGTKRLIEIRCPSDCPWLAVSRAHPPAAVRRQRERDARFVVPLMQHLSKGEYALLLHFQEVTRRYRVSAIPPLRDADVQEAAEACVATLETVSRGIIYEHQPGSLPAQRLMGELKAALEHVARETRQPARVEHDAEEAFRRMARAAREARTRLEASDTAYLDLLTRLPTEPGPQERTQKAGVPRAGDGGAPASPPERDEGPRIIIP